MRTSILVFGSLVLALGTAACAPEIIIAGQDQNQGGPSVNDSSTVIDKGQSPSNIISPGDSGPEACNGVELHVVGLYDPYNDATNTQGPANVHIDRPGQVKLFLSSYSATNWNVTAGPATEIVSIIAHGYDAQSVSAPAGVPTTTLSYAQGGVFLGCGYEYPDQDPTSGCETPELLANIEQYVGQSAASFHGCYAVSDFVIGADLASTSNCATNMGYSHTSMVATSCTTPPPPNPEEPPSPPQPNGCEGKTGFGLYEGYMCEPDLYPNGGPFIITQDILCEDALANCALNASANPSVSVQCTWNGEAIFVSEQQPGDCSP